MDKEGGIGAYYYTLLIKLFILTVGLSRDVCFYPKPRLNPTLPAKALRYH